jgi:hypothetical protein
MCMWSIWMAKYLWQHIPPHRFILGSKKLFLCFFLICVLYLFLNIFIFGSFFSHIFILICSSLLCLHSRAPLYDAIMYFILSYMMQCSYFFLSLSSTPVVPLWCNVISAFAFSLLFLFYSFLAYCRRKWKTIDIISCVLNW